LPAFRRTFVRISLVSLVLAGSVGLCLHLNRAGVARPAAPAPAANAFGVRFEDAAARLGLTYRYPRQPRPLRILEAFGAGCAFVDYNDDGWLDILLVSKPAPVLYRSEAGRRFVDVSAKIGLSAVQGDWKACAVGDYDGDGRQDLLLSGYHCLALLRNSEGGFRNVTRAAGLDPRNRGRWGSGAGFMDLDGNGTLDLVHLNYAVFGPNEPQYCELAPGVRSGCPPSQYRPQLPELWENLGGRFRDVSAASGMRRTSGKALVLAFSDLDGDGRPDFYIGNDGMPAELMRNRGGLKFENIGASSGAAYGTLAGNSIAAMGADWADYDRDGKDDLAVSAFSDEPYSLLHNDGDGLFQHTAQEVGIAEPTYKPLGFGTKWLDLDNDGWRDLSFVNGHVYDNTAQIDPQTTLRQPLMLFRSEAARRFTDLVPALGGDAARPILGRGSAVGDFDNDGRQDLLVVDYEGAPLLLHNRSTTPNHWLTLDLRSASKNRFAYGARITARAGQDTWTGTVSPASSYLSSSDPRVHLGLGSTSRLDEVTIRWPGGRQQVLRGVAADQVLQLTER
jgi:hypothetical protein